MNQLSAQDSQFLYMETATNYTHITQIGIYNPETSESGRFDFDALLKLIDSRLHLSPIFQRKLVRVPLDLDYPYWADDDYFDLESHVLYSRLPEPGTWEQLKKHVARYHSRPLDMNRPLWEMSVIDGVDAVPGVPRGGYAIAIKVHHAAVDGASATRFFTALADVDAMGTPVVNPDVPAEFSGAGPDAMQMVRRAIVSHATSPLRLANSLLKLAPSLGPLVASKLTGRVDEDSASVPHTRFNGKAIPQKMFDGTEFPLRDFKEIRQAVPHAKINDVVLAICSGAARRYLNARKELPNESLVAWVPINARQSKPQDEAGTGNRISAMTTSLHSDIEDPLACLGAITKSTQSSKAAKSGLSARMMTDLSQHIPGSTLALASRLMVTGAAKSFGNMIVSNVPGPQIPLYMNGAELVRQFGMAPLADGMSLFLTVTSYNGNVTFSITSTREIMPDSEFFVTCLRDAFTALLRASRPVSRKKNTTTANKKSKKSAKSKSA